MSTDSSGGSGNNKDLFGRTEKLLAYDPSDPPVAPMDELSRRRVVNAAVDAVLAEKGARPADSRIRSRLILTASAAMIAAAVAVGVILLLGQDKSDETPALDHAHTAAVVQPGEKEAPEAPEPIEISTGASPMSEGSSIETTAHPLNVEASGRTKYALSANSRMRVTTATEELLECYLEFGEVTVDVNPEKTGPEVAIATPHGRVRVTGTKFVVKVYPHDTEVRVLRGTVDIEGNDSTSIEVKGGFVARMAGEKPRIVADSLAAAPVEKTVPEPAVSAPVVSASAIKPPPDVDSVPVYSIKTTTGVETEPSIPVEPEATDAMPVDTEDASDLLKKAQALRKERLWNDAADAYEEIIARFPSSPSADIALVSSAMIRLNHLNAPGRALRNLDTYLPALAWSPAITTGSPFPIQPNKLPKAAADVTFARQSPASITPQVVSTIRHRTG